MNVENNNAMSGEAVILSRKSWLAYLGPVIACPLILLVAIPLLVQIFSWRVAIGAGILTVAYFAFRMLWIRSVKLYVDDAGVWVYSGVLPWSRGVAGVKWRDLDEAVYFQGLIAWATRAYAVRIGHRFTKSSELLLGAMSRGDQAVIEINTRHQAIIRAGAFD